jgi:transposase
MKTLRMLTPKRIVEVNAQGFKTVTALTHAQMQILLDNKIVNSSMFSRSNFPQINDPSVPHIRYILCFNPKRQQQDRATRLALIKKSKLKLDKIHQSKRKKQEKDIGISIGRIWEKYKTKKYFSISIENERLTYSINQSVIDREALLDGCYIIRTDVPQEELSAYEVVQTYRKLAQVEQAFRVIKTTLEIRPVYHHLDERICAHIFLCMLSYYVQWHMNKKLADLFAQDGKGQNRHWTFLQVIERLKSIRSQTIRIADSEIEQVVSKPDTEQQLLIDLLDTKV